MSLILERFWLQINFIFFVKMCKIFTWNSVPVFIDINTLDVEIFLHGFGYKNKTVLKQLPSPDLV